MNFCFCFLLIVFVHMTHLILKNYYDTYPLLKKKVGLFAGFCFHTVSSNTKFMVSMRSLNLKEKFTETLNKIIINNI